MLANVQFGVETGAAYFVDGIYYQGDIQGFDPLSIERVEIIKGPQSALYGRNTYAGAINYITKKSTDTFSASGRATLAEHNEYQLAGSVSGPIIPGVLGFRLGGRHFEYGGQYINQLTVKKVEFAQSVIHSRHRLTYKEAFALLSEEIATCSFTCAFSSVTDRPQDIMRNPRLKKRSM